LEWTQPTTTDKYLRIAAKSVLPNYSIQRASDRYVYDVLWNMLTFSSNILLGEKHLSNKLNKHTSAGLGQQEVLKQVYFFVFYL